MAIFPLEDYVRDGVMTETQKQVISKAIEEHRNILFAGGTGSGKTTLVNAGIREMVRANPDERIVIIEDTGEIQCTAENYIQFHTSSDVSMTKLLRTTLRMRPDRIIVGEVRGPEALDLLMAWNTGHAGGCATIHANNAKSALDRLAMLISMNPDAPRAIEPFIASAVDVVVHIAKTPEGRRVQELIEVGGYDHGTKPTTLKGKNHEDRLKCLHGKLPATQIAWCCGLLVLLIFFAGTPHAMASAAQGGGLPYETWLTNLGRA